MVPYFQPDAMACSTTFQTPAQPLTKSSIYLVNVFDANGNFCPAIIRTNQVCPTVCVADISQCPTAVYPNCPSGYSYCPDGTCQKVSSSAQCSAHFSPICSCQYGFNPALPDVTAILYPCLRNIYLVNVTDYVQDAITGDQPLYQACSRSLQVDTTVVVTNGAPSPFLLQCAPAPDPNINYSRPEFVLFFFFFAGEFLLLCIFAFYKGFNELVSGHSMDIYMVFLVC